MLDKENVTEVSKAISGLGEQREKEYGIVHHVQVEQYQIRINIDCSVWLDLFQTAPPHHG